MRKELIAHFTDAHLGQKPVVGKEIIRDEMRYDDVPGEHEVRLRRVLDDIARKNISEGVFGGDIGAEGSVDAFFQIIGAHKLATSIVVGNHDRRSVVSKYWNVGFNTVEGKMCSSRDDGPLKRIFLDSSDNVIGGDQAAWLSRELEGTAKAALFVHHPILPIETPLERSGATLKDRRDIIALLAGTQCEISVFCGHYHMADEANERNIRQYTTPAVSYQIAKQSNQVELDTRAFGYRVLEIDDSGLTTKAVVFTDAL